MPRRKFKRMTQHDLCREVAGATGVAVEDVEMMLEAFVTHIRNNLCLATPEMDSWVKVSDDVAFKAEYRPEENRKDYHLGESITPVLRYSDLEKRFLADEYKQAQFYARLMAENKK